MNEVMRVLPPTVGSQGIIMRIKRSRCTASESGELVAPPLLRVRLDSSRGVRVGCDASNNTKNDALDAPPTPRASGSVEDECQRRVLFFRLLERGACGAAGDDKTYALANSAVLPSNTALSVERVWDAQGNLVMDCQVVGKKSGEVGVVPVSSIVGDVLVGPGDSVAIDSEGSWSVYILDKGAAADAVGEVNEEEGDKNMKEDDVFGFGNLRITDDDDGESTAISCVKPYFAFRSERKRHREGTYHDYVLSFGESLANRSVAVNKAELLLYDALQKNYDDFLLDEQGAIDPELYLYPDHRKDDEYDSNAADFSANEYPDETSSSNSIRTDGMSTAGTYDDERCHRPRGVWGSSGFCGDSDVGDPLGSSWNDTDDGY